MSILGVDAKTSKNSSHRWLILWHLSPFWVSIFEACNSIDGGIGCDNDQCTQLLFFAIFRSHLVRWRQDLLDEFLNSGECYRGVYYQIPDERSQKHKKKKAEEEPTRASFLCAPTLPPHTPFFFWKLRLLFHLVDAAERCFTYITKLSSCVITCVFTCKECFARSFFSLNHIGGSVPEKMFSCSLSRQMQGVCRRKKHTQHERMRGDLLKTGWSSTTFFNYIDLKNGQKMFLCSVSRIVQYILPSMMIIAIRCSEKAHM